MFYRLNTKLVQSRQQSLFEEATGQKSSAEDFEPLELDAIEDDGSPEPATSTGQKKRDKPFQFFQPALTVEWEKLGPTEQGKYNAIAVEWREKGPSAAERKRCV